MNSSENNKPVCFGNLDTVFPLTENGLRESPEQCLNACPLKTQCLKTAMSKGADAVKVREERIDKAYDSGLMGFFERWSRKKYLKNSEKK